MPKVTEAIQNFLRARRTAHNGPDLLDRILAHPGAMEIQVNVAADNGELVDGKRSTYTDGEYEWFNVRIPKNAASEPEFRDYELRWPLDLHVEGIGWTGWDWQARRSRAVGFDFDAITGHAKGIGVSNEELERIKQAAMSLPYVEVRKSTGGAGLHPYVYFDDEGVPTANHTEHAALARCILGMMSSETGFDFASQIDACGGNMWFWHRKMTPENEGLKLIKPAEKVLSISDLPANWRDHIEVVTRRRAKVRVQVENEYLDPFEALTSARRVVPLDETHKQILDELSNSGFTTIWVSDHHLCQTHTKALEKLMESGKYKGIYRTISQGRNPGTPNCFWFPLENGGCRVYRFSPGVREAETWNQDREGWTNCYFNCRPNLATAAKAVGGQEDPDYRGFAFATVADAIKTAEVLGQDITLPESLLSHEARLKSYSGRLVMHITKKPGERDQPLDGWINRQLAWSKVFDVHTNPKCDEQIIKRRIVIPYLSCAELDSGSYELEYLIDGILVALQPFILAGARKSLKTTILIAMAISLATGLPFLGHFPVKRACRVIVLSGESGLSVIQETARRICRSMNIQLADITNLIWSPFIPQLDDTNHLNALEQLIKDTSCEVVAVDPAYLAMGGSEAGNVFIQGEKLGRISRLCERNKAGLILAHHTTRTSERQGKHKPPELDDIAWAGFSEWTRQWVLVGRREDYVPGSGDHHLWLSAGAAAGHSSLWALDISEGGAGLPRHWEVTVSTPSEAYQEKKTGSLRQRILAAVPDFPNGETMSVILANAGVKHDKKASAFVEMLVNEGKLIRQNVKKKGVTYDGFCLTQAT
ncbi:MAG: AAA family ATPase [Thermoguttaceae bacterium]